MINQENLSLFAKKIYVALPGIQALQILTTDGLPLLSDLRQDNEDQVSALSAALITIAQQLTGLVSSKESPKALMVCSDSSTYVVTRISANCVLGLQIPVEMGQPWLLQTVNGLITDHATQLNAIY